MHLTDYTVSQLVKLLQAKETSSAELTRAYLTCIEEKEPEIGAFLTVTAEIAMKEAEAVDRLRGKETLPPLAGIPMAVKDNICTQGIRTTCASRMLSDYVPPYSATVYRKLTAQRTVLLGKLNMDEFAMGSSTENSYFKITHNPCNPACVPGGSSGGSAAAVAGGMASFTLGSDTGGSIRQPASFCGVVGMKPTYGSVSRYGLVAFASSLDQIGPLTKNVEDSALILDAIRGYDACDATSVPGEYGSCAEEIGKPVTGMRFALPMEFFEGGISADVKAAVMAAASRLESCGAVVEEVSMPAIRHALPAYYVMSSAEASSNLARFDGIRYGYRSTKEIEDMDEFYKNNRSEGFGPEVKRRIMLGTFALSAGYYDAYYKKALQVRTLIVREFDKIFRTFDCILSPVTPATAYRIGEKVSDPLEMYLGDIYTVPVNIAGIPAISIPCGTDASGLPIGLQIMGRVFDEKTVYRAAYAFERRD